MSKSLSTTTSEQHQSKAKKLEDCAKEFETLFHQGKRKALGYYQQLTDNAKNYIQKSPHYSSLLKSATFCSI